MPKIQKQQDYWEENNRQAVPLEWSMHEGQPTSWSSSQLSHFEGLLMSVVRHPAKNEYMSSPVNNLLHHSCESKKSSVYLLISYDTLCSD